MVNFGENLRVDCALNLDRNGLKNMCTFNNFKTLALFNNFDNKIHFGQYGNANYYYLKDWISLNVLTQTPNVTWDDATSEMNISFVLYYF